MPITIRNKTTEELIRKIGRRTGEGPSALIRRWADAEARGEGSVPPQIAKERVERMRKLRALYKHPDDPKLTWDETEKLMDSIFD